MSHLPIPKDIEFLASVCVDAAFKVHRELGPGLLESVYERCMYYELQKSAVQVERQVILPIVYDGQALDDGLRLDLFVEKKLIVELKSVEKLLPVHKAQIITYLKLTHNRLGLLINFNVPLIKNGIKRVIID
jgi:GxxExxY protein